MTGDEGRYSGPTGREQILRRTPRGSTPAGPTTPGSPEGAEVRHLPSSNRARKLDEQREAELRCAVAAAAAELRRSLGGVLASADQTERSAAHQADAHLLAARHTRNEAHATAGNHAAQSLIEHRSKAIEASRSLAPGPAGATWNDPDLLTYEPSPTSAPACVRLGTLELPRGAVTNEQLLVPWLVPILDRESLTVASADPSTTDPVIVATVLRLLGAVAPGQLEVTWYDPRLRSVLSPLAPLRPSGVVAAALTEEADLEAHLGDLTATVAAVAEQRGSTYATLGALNQGSGRAVAPYRVLVVFDYPRGVSKRAHAALGRLVEQGRTAGIHVILQELVGTLPDEDYDPGPLAAGPPRIEVTAGGRIAHAEATSMWARFDDPPPPDLVAAVVDRVRRGDPGGPLRSPRRHPARPGPTMSSAERFDRYRSALAALDELPTRLAHERAAATAAYEQAASTAAAIRSTVQAQAEALREQVDQLLSQGRALAASMGEDGDLPAELEASGPPTDLSIARAALEQLAAAVEAVEAHRSLARRQRLDEARARERAAEEATARRVAAEEAERRAAAAREEQARAERFRLALRRARIGAAVVSLGTVVVAGPALAAGPRLGGVVLAVGGSAAWLVHRALEPHPGP